MQVHPKLDGIQSPCWYPVWAANLNSHVDSSTHFILKGPLHETTQMLRSKGHDFFSSVRYMWSFGKARSSTCRVRLVSVSLMSCCSLSWITNLLSSKLCKLIANAHKDLLSCGRNRRALVSVQKWRVHQRLWSSDSCSQLKSGLGRAYGKGELIKMGKEAVGVQEGTKQLIYGEAKAAHLKEIIILL